MISFTYLFIYIIMALFYFIMIVINITCLDNTNIVKKKNINEDLLFYFDYFNTKQSNDFCQKHT